MNVADKLAQPVLEHPDRTALIDAATGRSLTFLELDELSARGAALLQAQGLKAGDTVAVLVPVCAELYITVLALLRSGLTALFIDSPQERMPRNRCLPASPAAWIVHHRVRSLVPKAECGAAIGFTIGYEEPGMVAWSRLAEIAPRPEIVDIDRHAPALITFTSGSTGEPKAAVRTHANLRAQHTALERSLLLSNAAMDLSTLPVFVLANLASAVSTLLPSAIPFVAPDGAARLFSDIDAHKPTRITTSPAVLEALSEHCRERQVQIECVRQILVGGAPVFPSVLDRIQAAFPRAEVRVVYGATEAEPISHYTCSDLAPGEIERMCNGAGLLAGFPDRAINVAILKNCWGRPVGPFTAGDFHSACQPPSIPGEIVVSGEHVLTSAAEPTNGSVGFRVGDVPWHRTGDAGYLDADGRLWLLGRCEACTATGPEVLYPFQAESMVLRQPGIRCAAFVEHRGRTVLVVEPRSGEFVDLPALRTSFEPYILDDVLPSHIPVDNRLHSKTDYPALRKLLDQRS